MIFFNGIFNSGYEVVQYKCFILQIYPVTMSLITLGLLQISPQIKYYIEIAQNEAAFNLNFQIISVDHNKIFLE